jgi:hypothetical protein
MPGSERETTARRVLRRSIFERGNRADLPVGCPEHVDWALFKSIWRFDRPTWPRIDAARIEQGTTVPTYSLRSRCEINDFLAALPERAFQRPAQADLGIERSATLQRE